MRITAIALYQASNDKLDIYHPVAHPFHSITRVANQQIEHAIETLSLRDAPATASNLAHVTLGDEWVYAKKMPDNCFIIFATDTNLIDPTLYQCFALIKTHLKSGKTDVKELIQSIETVCADATALTLAAQKSFMDKAKQAQTDLEQIKTQMLDNIDKVLERGERIESLLAKSEQLAKTAVGFKTNAFRFYQPASEVELWFKSLFECTEPDLIDQKKYHH